MTDLTFATAAELAPLIESRQLSPVELTEQIMDRIRQIDPTIKSYITPTPELAIREARKAEREIMQGFYKGPLHGIPVGIKDNFYTKGIRTTVGSKLFADSIPDKTATSAKKLLDAGGIILGKLNMHELAAGSTGTNPYFGTQKNPWNIDYMPGGSSGGSSAALAAGLATLATGTDTFGSIRLPAAMTGTYGLKVTYGLVSTEGIFPTAPSLDTSGLMARTVPDLALMLQYMAGYDPSDPVSLKVPVPNYMEDLHKGIRELKVGIPTYYMEGLDRDVEILFLRAIETLKSLGTEVIEIAIPELSMSTFSGYAIVAGEAANTRYEWLQTRPEDYSVDIRSFFLAGALADTPPYVRAQQARRKMTEAFDKAFQDVDMMLGPTIPITTPAYVENWVEQNLEVVRRCMPFTVPINLTGVPSLSVPIGLCSAGLPVGMQFIGKHLDEKRLLQVGTEWKKTNPMSIGV